MFSRNRGIRLALAIASLVIMKGFWIGFGQLQIIQVAQAQTNSELGCSREELDDNQYLACLQDKETELKSKIDDTKQEAHTLSSAISLINSQAQLQRLQIAQTQAEISLLEKEIEELGERIDGLILSLDRLSSMLVERVNSSYKQQRTSSILSLFANNGFSTIVTQLKYLQQAEKQTARAMQEAENQRLVYDEQKSLKEVKQEKLQGKREQLQVQQRELDKNKESKERLLAQTRNNEATYQRLLTVAQTEINSFRSFVLAQFGSSYCLDSPAPQPDGWFFSQRDSRWCGANIGNSSDTVGAVGCLITSVAMIWKKYGFDASPLSIANNPSYFWLQTAFMIDPAPAPPGFKYTRYDRRDLDLIDRELAEGRPVIVRISVSFNSVGTHFIVLKSGSNSDYIMNDPIYQADMPFNSKYSTSQITSIRTIIPN